MLPFKNHLKSYQDLITPHAETRKGFIALALEKNKKATPFVEEAKALTFFASKAKTPKDLLKMDEVRNALVTASGISNKAKKHLKEEDLETSIKGLIKNFLEPAGQSFVDELIYRFLLTKGDSLGGSMRNLAGKLGEERFTKLLMDTCSKNGIALQCFDPKTKQWINLHSDKIEKQVKSLHWIFQEKNRLLLYNVTVPIAQKNVDLCLLEGTPNDIIFGKNQYSVHHHPEKYLALGELKGGIDPAGADEHWKTANSALTRIRTAFSKKNCHPQTFFVGGAIERAMAKEIYQQLHNQTLSNGANLTQDSQVISLCQWLIKL